MFVQARQRVLVGVRGEEVAGVRPPPRMIPVPTGETVELDDDVVAEARSRKGVDKAMVQCPSALDRLFDARIVWQVPAADSPYIIPPDGAGPWDGRAIAYPDVTPSAGLDVDVAEAPPPPRGGGRKVTGGLTPPKR